MRRVSFLAAIAVTLAIVAAVSAETVQGILNPEETRTVTERVQKIRALKFLHPVPFSYLTVDQSQARLRAELARDTTPAELQLEAREGELIGLYPPKVDLAKENLTMLKSQLAGFYDPRQKDMVIIERPIPANPMVNPRLLEFALKLSTAGVLAHELTHALQDQHFDITAEQKATRGNADRELALRALLEGDATLSGFCSVVGRADDPTIDYFLDNSADASVIFLGSAEGLGVQMRKLLIFPYLDGARFVAAGYHRGGWAAVDAIYRNPPQSTRQIIHPELYFDHPEAPVRGACRRLRKDPRGVEKSRRGYLWRAGPENGDRALDRRADSLRRGGRRMGRRPLRRAAKIKRRDFGVDCRVPRSRTGREFRGALSADSREVTPGL